MFLIFICLSIIYCVYALYIRMVIYIYTAMQWINIIATIALCIWLYVGVILFNRFLKEILGINKILKK